MGGVPIDPEDMEFEPDPEAHVHTRVAEPFSPIHNTSRPVQLSVPAIPYLNNVHPSQQHPIPQAAYAPAPSSHQAVERTNSQQLADGETVVVVAHASQAPMPSQPTVPVQEAQVVQPDPAPINMAPTGAPQQPQAAWAPQPLSSTSSRSSLDTPARSTPSPSSGVSSPPDTPVTTPSSAWPSPRLLASAAPLAGNPSPLGLGATHNQAQGTHTSPGRTLQHTPSLQHLRPRTNSLRRETSLQHLRAAREALSPIPHPNAATGLTPTLATLNTGFIAAAGSASNSQVSSPVLDGPSADGQLPPGLGRKNSTPGTPTPHSAAPEPHARSRAALHRVGPYAYASAPPSPHPSHARSGWIGRMRDGSPPDAITEDANTASRGPSPGPGLTREQRRDLKESLKQVAQDQQSMTGMVQTTSTSTVSELAGALNERVSFSPPNPYAYSLPADQTTAFTASPPTDGPSSPTPSDYIITSPPLAKAFAPTPSGTQTPAADIHSPPLSATPSPNVSHAPSPVATPRIHSLTRHASLGALGFARLGSGLHIKNSLAGAVADVYSTGFSGLNAATDYMVNGSNSGASADSTYQSDGDSTGFEGGMYSPTQASFFGSNEPGFGDMALGSAVNSLGYNDSAPSHSQRTPLVPNKSTPDSASMYSPPTYPQQLSTGSGFSTLGGALGTDPGGPGMTTGLARYGGGAGPSLGGIGMTSLDGALGWDTTGFMGMHGMQGQQPEPAPTCVQPAMLFSPSVTPEGSREASPSDPADATREARPGSVGKVPRVKTSRSGRDRKAEKEAKKEKKKLAAAAAAAGAKPDVDMTAALVANGIPGAVEVAAAAAELRRARTKDGEDVKPAASSAASSEAAVAPAAEVIAAAPVAGPSTAPNAVKEATSAPPPPTPATGVPSHPLPGTLPAHAATALILGKPLLSKPFRCPNPGCSKSYKQANGLKYHQQHGQCSFLQAKDVEIRDKLLEARANLAVAAGSLPGTRPGTPGGTMTEAEMQAYIAGLGPISEAELRELEKEAERALRPFACTVDDCQRRYKNMNGLRYHYQHTADHGAVGLALLATGQHPCLQNRGGSRTSAAAAEDLKKERKSSVISAAGTGGATAARTPRAPPRAVASATPSTMVPRTAAPVVASGMVGYAGQRPHAHSQQQQQQQPQQKIYAPTASYGAQPGVPSPLGYAQEFSVPHSGGSAAAAAATASSSSSSGSSSGGSAVPQGQKSPPSTAQQHQDYTQMAYHAQYEAHRQQYQRQYQQQQQQIALAQQQQAQAQAQAQAQQHGQQSNGGPGYREPEAQ
ncbi:hypothetical protein HGRIS_010824 [Hohenbuehelia grisea]